MSRPTVEEALEVLSTACDVLAGVGLVSEWRGLQPREALERLSGLARAGAERREDSAVGEFDGERFHLTCGCVYDIPGDGWSNLCDLHPEGPYP